MAHSRKLRPVAWTAVAVFALGLVVSVYLQPETSTRIEDSERESMRPHGAAVTEEGSEGPVETALRHQTARSLQPGSGVPGRERATAIVVEVTIPHDVLMDDYKRDLWEQIEADPPDLDRLDERVIDADMAYRLYMYYGNCSMAPRTGNQADRQLERIENRAERARGMHLERLEGRADDILDDYALCSHIPPEADARMEAVAWMSKAVRLGHGVAEVQFYEKAMGFILRPDRYTNSPPLALQHSGLVMEFKDTARLAFARAMAKGHPEAYLGMSRAVLEGLIYPRDPVLAYAYALRAEMEGRNHRTIVGNAGYWKAAAAQYLDQEQIAEARHLALEMHAAPDD